jgi:hypothetical protein
MKSMPWTHSNLKLNTMNITMAPSNQRLVSTNSKEDSHQDISQTPNWEDKGAARGVIAHAMVIKLVKHFLRVEQMTQRIRRTKGINLLRKLWLKRSRSYKMEFITKHLNYFIIQILKKIKKGMINLRKTAKSGKKPRM